MLINYDSQGTALIAADSPKEMLSVVTSSSGHHAVKINFSSLTILQECWRKTQYSLIRGLRNNLESPATLFGSAIHKALEVFYSADRTERKEPKDYADKMLMIGSGHWNEDWADNLLLTAAHEFVLKAAPLKALPDQNKRSLATGVWMLQHYFKKYLTDPYVIVHDSQGPIVERRFTMRIHEEANLSVDLFGTIDFVLKNEATGEILPGDHKTTSMLGTPFYQRLNPNHQYTAYTWAANEVLGLQTESFLVNALQVKEMPKTARGTPPDFARQITTRTKEDFAELKSAILTSVRELLRRQQANEFPMTAPGPCSNYGGCQFLDICSAPAQLRENIISAKFKEALK